MIKKYLVIVCFMVTSTFAWSQNTRTDTIPVTDDLGIDTSIDYDELLSDLDLFLDSLLSPRSFFLANASAANGYFNYSRRDNTNSLLVQKKLILSPTLGYYHKSGPGIAVSANIIQGRKDYNLYQYSVTPSFDFIQNRKWAGGLSYTRYITKDSLPFYTTPLQNEVGGYFLWRDGWIQPGLTANYGWGSRSDLEKRQYELTRIILRRRLIRNTNIGGSVIDTIKIIDTIVTKITTRESIADFLLTASIRHTFYWLDVLGTDDCIRFTPMLALSFGTQQFGFNQTTASHVVNRNAADVQFNRGDVSLDEKLKFQPVSLTLYLRPEYNIGKFFIQPQLMIDYYFPADKNNLTTFFSINAGFMF